MPHLLLPRQVDSVLSLPSPPSAPAPVVEYIASIQQCTRHLYLSRSTSRCTSSVRYICTCGEVNAPASAHTLHLRLPWSTSRQHNQSYAAQAQVLSTLCQRLHPMLLFATVTGGFGSLFVEPTVFSCSRLPRLVHTCSLSNGCCCALAKLPFINL